jgi:hypothetical protein
MTDFSEQPLAPRPPAPPEGPPRPTQGTADESLPLPRRSFLREQRPTVVVAALVSALVATAVVLGFELVRRPGSVTSKSDLLEQSGEMSLRNGESVEVFYPIPYDLPPNLSLSGGDTAACKILEQKADRFRVTYAGGFTHTTATWRSLGKHPTAGEQRQVK